MNWQYLHFFCHSLQLIHFLYQFLSSVVFTDLLLMQACGLSERKRFEFEHIIIIKKKKTLVATWLI